MKKGKKFIIFILLLAAVITALLLDSRYRLVLTEYEISSEKIPESFDGFTVVQLSDLHGASYGKGNTGLLEKVRAEAPDVITLTGDIADSDTDMSVIDTLLGKLSTLCPVYYVSGNHEWAEGILPELKQLFEKHGVIYLQNEYEELRIGEESIVIAGVEDPNGWEDMISPDLLMENISSEYPDSFRLLLAHRNYWAVEYPELEADAVLCGHAHGGIVRLPFFGGIIGTGFTLFPEYEAGLYELERYSLVVSRGLGSSVPIPRFLNNPEIVLVKLKTE